MNYFDKDAIASNLKQSHNRFKYQAIAWDTQTGDVISRYVGKNEDHVLSRVDHVRQSATHKTRGRVNIEAGAFEIDRTVEVTAIKLKEAA